MLTKGPMRTSWRALVVLALAAAPVAALDLAEIQKRGELRVLVVDGSPAFFALKAGEPPGMEREILDGFAALHKLTLKVVEVPSWEALVPSLLEGKGDLIAGGVTTTTERRKVVDFTSEVFPTRDVVVTRKPHRVVQRLEELREERVGTIRGTSLADSVAATGVPPKNVDDAIAATGFAQALRSQRVTAIVDGVEDALRLQQADSELQLGMFVGPPESLALGVAKGQTALLAALNEYVTNVRRSPTWSRLVVKYFGGSALEVLRKARGE